MGDANDARRTKGLTHVAKAARNVVIDLEAARRTRTRRALAATFKPSGNRAGEPLPDNLFGDE